MSRDVDREPGGDATPEVSTRSRTAPLLCMFSWPLRSYLAVPDDYALLIDRPPRRRLIRCRRAEGATAFSYTGTDFRWLGGGAPGDEYYMFTAEDAYGREVVVRRVYGADRVGAFEGGVIDPEPYTLAEVVFELDSERQLEDDAEFKRLREWVASDLRRLILVYQIATSEADVARLDVDDTPVVQVFTAREYTFEIDNLEAYFEWHSRSLAVAPPSRRSVLKGELAPEELQRLTGMLRSPDDPLVYQQLLVDAISQAHNFANYDLSIVVSGTAFEVFLKARLTEACESRGITELPAGRGRSQDAGVHYREAIERAQARELLQFVQVVTRENVREGAEHNAWFERAYRPRNEIVHRGARGASEEQAEAAFEAVMEFILRINRAFDRQDSGTTGATS